MCIFKMEFINRIIIRKRITYANFMHYSTGREPTRIEIKIDILICILLLGRYLFLQTYIITLFFFLHHLSRWFVSVSLRLWQVGHNIIYLLS